jgi:hypothetical protein
MMKKILRREVKEVYIACQKDDWDGHGANRMPYDSYIAVVRLIRALPQTIIKPDVVPEPSGKIGLEWNVDNKNRLVLSVSERTIFYAAILGVRYKINGHQPFVKELPMAIKEILSSYFSREQEIKIKPKKRE